MPLNLAYREIGTGDPIVILHGLMGSENNWRSIAKQLALTHHVFTVDLRNHGKSPHSESMSYQEMAEDLNLLLDHLSLEKIILMGHSLGGKAAMTFALNYAKRLSHLLVIDIAPVSYYDRHSPLIEILQKVDFDKLRTREAIEQSLKKQIPDNSMRLFLLQNLQRTNQSFKWKCNLEAIKNAMAQLTDFPTESVEKTFSKPALFIGGSDSDYVLRQHYSIIYQLFSNNNIVMIKNAGHWVHANQPQIFIKTVSNFIKPS